MRIHVNSEVHIGKETNELEEIAVLGIDDEYYNRYMPTTEQQSAPCSSLTVEKLEILLHSSHSEHNE